VYTYTRESQFWVQPVVKLQDKIALVTGGGQGLGFGMARAFADAGAKLVLTDRVQENLDTKAEFFRTQGAEILTVLGDVRYRSTAQDVVARALAAFGRIDILVNNAQTLSPTIPLAEQDDVLIEQVIRSGLFGTIYFMQEAYPSLKRQGGAIINLASGQGVIGGVGHASYAAAKEGIRGLSRVAAREWGKDGIRVNVICPSAKTQSLTDWFNERPGDLEVSLKQMALGRFAEPYEDVGRLVVYLAGPDCFLTGQTIFVDGGMFFT
jgi:NAD(P)-dependent dehydrogenase (short-subunit alcohol dehydrogenase family)